MEINAYACRQTGEILEKFQYEAQELGPLDVRIQITHCGICHSDIHLIDNDWGINAYPLVPGHEIIGTITEMGDQVTGLSEGQRVGVGWQRGSCQKCSHCERHEENVCTRMEATCVGNYGGMADAICTDSRFVIPIPDGLDSILAAPLMCAGVTVFAPMLRHGVGDGMKVAVLGIGGLGHLAIQFARALGADVSALSSTPEKEQEARDLGAYHFIDTNNGAQMKRAGRSFDFVLNTVSANIDWPSFLSILKPHGKFCLVGAPKEPLVIPAASLIGGQKSIAGSSIGGTEDLKRTLAYADEHDIKPKVDLLPMSQVNAGISKVRNNMARYRVVLEN
ncbi:MAG: NAD(P)-dependent alcohol dehydrogenase [Gammaproteobacteria bacterium]|nr:NAD(P)-dependent alcohol dehydrogenase [Gammaproteobacteria bacterium]